MAAQHQDTKLKTVRYHPTIVFTADVHRFTASSLLAWISVLTGRTLDAETPRERLIRILKFNIEHCLIAFPGSSFEMTNLTVDLIESLPCHQLVVWKMVFRAPFPTPGSIIDAVSQYGLLKEGPSKDIVVNEPVEVSIQKRRRLLDSYVPKKRDRPILKMKNVGAEVSNLC